MRRLVVFSDPGGAKPCLALARKWREAGEVLVCSDRRYAFFDMFGIPVRPCTGAEAREILDEFKPSTLYTGTSYTSSIELDFLRETKKRGIASASFVDHYTGFRERFETSGAEVFPDQIDVLDERARILAIKAGLPPGLLWITGNPYHEFLRSWRSGISKEALWKELGIPQSGAKSILFAPDPLSNAGGVGKFGNDEVGILQLLLEALSELGTPVQLIIKAHPNQSVSYLQSGLEACPQNVQAFIRDAGIDPLLNELIHYSDLLVGMFSSILTESLLIGTKAASILIGISPTYASSAPAQFCIGNIQQLKDELTRINHEA
jgi:hypothetical protein